LSIPTGVHAQDKEQDSQRCIRESRIKIGFEVAPVPLNLWGSVLIQLDPSKLKDLLSATS
jgi:hypothetical protein